MLHQRTGHRETKGTTGAARHFARRLLLTRCLLLLSVALSACFSPVENPFKDTRVLTVSFEKNCTSRLDEFARKNIKPPAENLGGDFPENPTCPGHRFVGWNTERDGSGTFFTAETSINFSNIIVIVFAQWDPVLRVEVRPGTIAFSPMKTDTYNGSFATFSVRVSGFKNEADADSVKLEVGNLDKPSWLSLGLQDSDFSEGAKTFNIHVRYDGSTFAEDPSAIRLNLTNIPKDYGYDDKARNLHVAIGDGQKNHPIPIVQANIQAFNDYASEDGLTLHYKLIEDIVLEAPALPKTSNWAAIGRVFSGGPLLYFSSFAGSFDGDGHAISGLVIHNPDSDCQGLFCSMDGQDAEIKNLALIDVNVKGNFIVGGLVGNNSGTVRNSYVTGSVEGLNRVGGLAGASSGTVQNSYAMGSVKGTSNVVGGLVGMNSSINSTVQNSYATGSVEGNSEVGGLVGANIGTVQNSYAAGSVKANNDVGGLVGVNYAVGTLIATVQNCVALNPSVIGRDANVGRVVGNNAGTLLANHARSTGMTLTHNNGNNYPPVSGQSLRDGQNTSTYGTQDFWTTTWTGEARWDFETIWQWGPNNLPILRNVGDTQNHTLP